MKITLAALPDVLVIDNVKHGDERGYFLEWFRADRFADATGHSFGLAQANCSVSARGTMRGIHYAAVPPGQAKFVTCMTGAILDVAVDLRIGSPTFGGWISERLDSDNRRAMYLPEGVGHAFLALDDATTVVYLCSTPYTPEREFEINPLDPAVGIEWPADVAIQLSAKDAAAPTLAEAAAAGSLPTFQACQHHLTDLKQSTGATGVLARESRYSDRVG